MFGVCANELSADGHVVDAEYGCGAHSDTPAPAGTGSPLYDPYDDGVLEVTEPPAPSRRAAEPRATTSSNAGDEPQASNDDEQPAPSDESDQAPT